jgi:leukotriene-A4 hydrolase
MVFTTNLLRVLLLPCCCLLLSTPSHVGAVDGVPGSSKDPSSYANVDQFSPSHISFDLEVSFEDSSTAGTITHTMEALEANVTTVYLDVWDGLEVFTAEFRTDQVDGFAEFAVVTFEITTPNPNIGNALGITLPIEMAAGTEFFLRLAYRTNADNTALSWMTPSQTAGKVLPFMYSLCQLNFCRDMAPMMDTPSMKLTYDATIVAPKELAVYMSANETESMDFNATHKVSSFACDIKVPSYLIAIVVGDLEVRSLNNRVRVMSEPVLLDSAVTEFSELTTAFDFVEDYLTPYIWGNYTLVIMPPSFPWSGMEHPMMTFASPTLITGDKSQVSNAFHQLTHSWFGNDVGCQNWDNFWLNEGLNTFMERKVLTALRGENFAKIDYFIGSTNMYFGDILYFGLDDSYSSLFPDIGEDDPENAFSRIPYEKGSQFMYYIQSLIGEDLMQSLLRLYINTFAQTAINSMDFKMLYETFLSDNFDAATAADIISQTDWDAWVYDPGVPPVAQDFRTDELDEAQALAREYASLGGASSPANFSDYFGYFGEQQVVFVQELAFIETVDIGLLTYIDSELMLSTTLNPKVKKEWYVLGIMRGYSPVMEPAYIWIGEQGRTAYVNPIFEALVDVGSCATAVDWLADYESFYNSYVVGGVSRVLVANCEGNEEIEGVGEKQGDGESAASIVAVTVLPLVTAMMLAVVAF